MRQVIEIWQIISKYNREGKDTFSKRPTTPGQRKQAMYEYTVHREGYSITVIAAAAAAACGTAALYIAAPNCQHLAL